MLLFVFFSIEFPSIVTLGFTSLNLAFISRESRVFLIISFRLVSGLSTHSAHAMLRTPMTSCCEVHCLHRRLAD